MDNDTKPYVSITEIIDVLECIQEDLQAVMPLDLIQHFAPTKTKVYRILENLKAEGPDLCAKPQTTEMLTDIQKASLWDTIGLYDSRAEMAERIVELRDQIDELRQLLKRVIENYPDNKITQDAQNILDKLEQ